MGKSERALEFLRKEGWARRLVESVEGGGGPRHAPAGLLFELRFAYEARLACPDSPIDYEFDAGVHGSTVDFRLVNQQIQWLIELVGIDESRMISSMRDSSRVRSPSGVVTETVYLTSSADNPRETPFAELVRVGEKIEEKVWDKATGRPRKFPESRSGWGHILVVNMNGFEGTGDPDGAHCRELVCGSKTISPEDRSDGQKMIVGLFDPCNARPGAIALQRSVDVIVFVAERTQDNDDEEIRRTAFFLSNPRMNGRTLVSAFPIKLADNRRDPLNRSDDNS